MKKNQFDSYVPSHWAYKFDRALEVSQAIKEKIEGKFVDYYSVTARISIIHTKRPIAHLLYKGPGQMSRRHLAEKKELLDEFDAAIRLHYHTTCDKMNVSQADIALNGKHFHYLNYKRGIHISHFDRIQIDINREIRAQYYYKATGDIEPLNDILLRLDSSHKFATFVSYPTRAKKEGDKILPYNIEASPLDIYLSNSFETLGYLPSTFPLVIKPTRKLKYLRDEIKRLNIKPRVNELREMDQP